jgi:hypothetical protein
VNPPSPESNLPDAIRTLGDLRGNEYAWRRHDLPRVFDAAKDVCLGNLGGQVQFRLPDGTCELYWENFDVVPRRPEESWDDFVDRSRVDVEAGLCRIPSDDALVADGLTHFDFLRERAAAGADIAGGLYFVCYFASPEDSAEISVRLSNER